MRNPYYALPHTDHFIDVTSDWGNVYCSTLTKLEWQGCFCNVIKLTWPQQASMETISVASLTVNSLCSKRSCTMHCWSKRIKQILKWSKYPYSVLKISHEFQFSIHIFIKEKRYALRWQRHLCSIPAEDGNVLFSIEKLAGSSAVLPQTALNITVNIERYGKINDFGVDPSG